jgi:hypothetical protein
MKRSGPRRTITALAWATVPLWLSPLGWYLAFSPVRPASIAGMLLISAELVLVYVILAALGVLLVGPVMLLFRPYRRTALICLGMAGLFLLSVVGGLYLRLLIWRDRLERLVTRSEPLVGAIHAFAAQRGRPPESLGELVPDYLGTIPGTGIGTFPEYRYVVGEPERYDGNPWALIVTPPCHPLGFDLFLYFPRQNYPEAGYGGTLERIGTWAYVHE